jgi:hypothetical protein
MARAGHTPHRITVIFPRKGVQRNYAFANDGTRDQVLRVLRSLGIEAEKREG